MPFADATFDAAITLHVAMNIKDRAGLYRESARVLKRGAVLCIYDVMQGPNEGLTFPVPWAETAANSHLTTPQEMQALLADAGFSVEEVEDRTEFGIAFFRERLSAGGPPAPLGLHLLMGATARAKFQNMLHGLEQGAIAPVVMIARRSA
jgi:SAM-dependent methyltransferase